MVIGRPRAGWPVLVALLIGVLAALPAVTHCLHGPGRHERPSIISAAATQVGANGGALTHRRADNATNAKLCHSVGCSLPRCAPTPGSDCWPR